MPEWLENVIYSATTEYLARWAAVLVPAVLVAVWAYVRKLGPIAVVYGLVSGACLLYLFSALGPQPSAESRVRRALEQSGHSYRKIKKPQEGHPFVYVVTDETGIPINVWRERDRSFVTVGANVELSSRHRQLFDALSETEKTQLLDVLRRELIRYGVQFVIDMRDKTRKISLYDIATLPDELDLLKRINYVRGGTHLITIVVRSQLEYSTPELTQADSRQRQRK